MKKVLVYDLPTRFFHWIFAGLFVAAFIIGKTVDDDSPVFSYHMIAGLILTLAVAMRIIWGFVGSRYARFSSFELNPASLFKYFKDMATGVKTKVLGHNPASSWAAIVMIILALGLGVTGYLMVNGQKETFEDVHELFANLFLATAIAHVLGVIVHTIRHRDPIGLSMMTGKKSAETEDGQISSSHSAAGLIFLVVVCYAGVYGFRNFDSNTRTLNVFGKVLQLGENEENEGGNGGGGKDSDGDDD